MLFLLYLVLAMSKSAAVSIATVVLKPFFANFCFLLEFKARLLLKIGDCIIVLIIVVIFKYKRL